MTDTPPLDAGTLVERYEVLGLLGEGGLARVYRVRHTQLGTTHALKLLTLRRNGLAERLLLEGRIQAQLRHPNVVAVTDVVQHDGQPGLIIEFVEGPTLEDWLRNETSPTVEVSLDLFSQVLAGVRAAHLVSVLHRDLKPANILLHRLTARDGAQTVVPKVADFGIAKVAMETAPGDTPVAGTRVGVAMGTPGYMAPEQFNDASGVDVRADIFALGTILYEILTGRPTFSGPTLLDTLNAVASGRYVPLRQLNPGVPDNVADAVARAVSADPASRFESCDAFAEAVFSSHPELRDRVIYAMPAGPVELSRRPTAPGPKTPEPARTSPSRPSMGRGTQPSATMVHGDPAPATMLPGALEPDEPARPPAPKRDRRPILALAGLGIMTVIGIFLFAVTWTATRPTPPPQPALIQPQIGIVDPNAGKVAVPSPATNPVDPATARPPASAVPPTATIASPTPSPLAHPQASAPPPASTVPSAGPAPSPPPTPPQATEPAVAAVEPAAVPEPVAVVAAAPPADVKGTWTGRWNGHPLTLRIESQTGSSVKARVEVLLGTTPRTWSASGTFSGSTLALTGEDGFTMNGTLSGGKFAGMITAMGQKASAWDGVR